MNVEEYISSGIIEAYVLGTASAEEISSVEKMAAAHPEVQQAIDAYQESLETYAQMHAVKPDAKLRDRVLNAIHEEGDKNRLRTIPGLLNADQSTKKIRLYKMLAVAASVLLLVSLSVTAVYISKYKESKYDYRNLLAAQEQMASSNQSMQTKMERMEGDMKLLTNPEVKAVVMKGVSAHPDMIATVYYDQASHKAYFGHSNLPTPPPGKAYQLWAIIDGKPVDMGMYDPLQVPGLKPMKTASGNIQAFAVTLEKEGGSAVPTMDQMYVMGNI